MRNIVLILMLILTMGCRKEINLNLPDVDPKVVVEGYIENGEYAWVGLTYSQPYLEPIDLSGFNMDPEYIDKLSRFFVFNATVTVSNGEDIDTLRFGIAPVVMQGGITYPPIRYMGSKIKGEVGKRYELRIVIGEQVYTSSTSITTPMVADSVFFIPDMRNDSLGNIEAYITDDATTDNYYRYYTKRIGKDDDFVPAPIPPMSDKYFNGKSFRIPIYRGAGYSRYDNVEDPDDGMFRIGDTVIIKSVTMDNQSFLFWSSLSSSGMGGSPAPAITNIKGGALGVWCGFGIALHRFVCGDVEMKKRSNRK